MRRLLLLVPVALVLLSGFAVSAQTDEPIRLREKEKYVNEKVTVKGITGKKLEDVSETTKLYTLVDDFNDEIKVRTSQGWPDIGVSFVVKGAIILDGRLNEFILLEESRERVVAQPTPQATPSPVRWWTRIIPGIALPAWLFVGGVLLVAGIAVVLLAARPRPRQAAAVAPQPQAGEGGGVAERQAVRRETLEAWGRLAIVSGPDSGKAFHLSKNRTTLGRANADILIASDELVSGSHGTVVRTNDGRVLFIDESRNGSKVNGKLVHMNQVEIESGARIEVGTTVLEFTSFQQLATGPGSRAETVQMGPSQRPTEMIVGELEVVSGPDTGKRYGVRMGTTTLGRQDDRDIRLSDAAVSRKHASVAFEGGTVFLVDESSSGTFIRGEKVQKRALEDGDLIKMGTTTLKFVKRG